MSKFNPQARRLARRYALQALYQWHMSGNDLLDIERHFLNNHDMKNVDKDYFHDLFHNIPKDLDEIDAAFQPHLDRNLQDLNPIELCTLRIGSYELLKRLDIPYKVAINEAVELAKKFGAEEGYKYVNGILDKVAQTVRSQEV